MPKETDKEQEFVGRIAALKRYFEECAIDYNYLKVLWDKAEESIKLGGQKNIEAGMYAKRKLLSIDVEDEEFVCGAEIDLIEENTRSIKNGKPKIDDIFGEEK